MTSSAYYIIIIITIIIIIVITTVLPRTVCVFMPVTMVDSGINGLILRSTDDGED
jgi:hypothetical protein